jgi:hypothetical protein
MVWPENGHQYLQLWRAMLIWIMYEKLVPNSMEIRLTLFTKIIRLIGFRKPFILGIVCIPWMHSGRNARLPFKLGVDVGNKSSEMWRCVGGRLFTDVSNDRSAITFRDFLILRMTVVRSFKTSEAARPTTRRHIQEDFYLQQERCVNPRSRRPRRSYCWLSC